MVHSAEKSLFNILKSATINSGLHLELSSVYQKRNLGMSISPVSPASHRNAGQINSAGINVRKLAQLLQSNAGIGIVQKLKQFKNWQ